MNCFEYRFQANFQHIDPAGQMFFAHLFSHAHDAYAAFMDNSGYDLPRLMNEGRYHLPLVHAEADFLAPIRLMDTVEVQLYTEHLGNSSFGLAYRFFVAEQLAARLLTRHVWLDTASGRPEPLPEALRGWLARHSIGPPPYRQAEDDSTGP